MKLGIECEGRLKGLKTLFISAEEFKHDLSVENYITQHYSQLQQVYIVDKKNILREIDLIKLSLFTHCLTVTIEVQSLSYELLQFNHLFNVILSVEMNDAFHLKSTDQFKVHYNNHVMVVPIEMMIKSSPEDFVNDQKIEL